MFRNKTRTQKRLWLLISLTWLCVSARCHTDVITYRSIISFWFWLLKDNINKILIQYLTLALDISGSIVVFRVYLGMFSLWNLVTFFGADAGRTVALGAVITSGSAVMAVHWFMFSTHGNQLSYWQMSGDCLCYIVHYCIRFYTNIHLTFRTSHCILTALLSGQKDVCRQHSYYIHLDSGTLLRKRQTRKKKTSL